MSLHLDPSNIPVDAREDAAWFRTLTPQQRVRELRRVIAEGHRRLIEQYGVDGYQQLVERERAEKRTALRSFLTRHAPSSDTVEVAD